MIHKVKNLTLAILTTYFLAIVSLQYPFFLNPQFTRAIIEQILLSLPIIIIVMGMIYFLKIENHSLKRNYFQQDFLIINIFFIWGVLISFIIDHNNSDLRGWWSLGLLILFFYSLGFSFLYASISIMFSFHSKSYTSFSAYLILIILSTASLYHNTSIGLFMNIDPLYIWTTIFLLIHLIICLIKKVDKIK